MEVTLSMKKPTLGLPTEHLFEAFTKKRILEELIYGSVAGLFICLGGHPFDTLKTRIQMDNTHLMHTVRNIWINEGMRGYYKGLAAPLASVPALNAIIFASFELSKRAIQIARGESELSLIDYGLAGGASGLVSASIVTPVELIKCKMQMQKKFRKYKTSIDCLLKLVYKNGIRGLYQGNLITTVREISGNGAQFFTYELAKRYLFGPQSLFSKLSIRENRGEPTAGRPKGPVSTDVTGWRAMVCGGLAGFNAWLFSYGADIIKTKIQCHNLGYYRSHYYDGGTWTIAKEIYRTDGLLGFMKGFNAITGRAVIGNALGFWGWETSRKLISLDSLLDKESSSEA